MGASMHGDARSRHHPQEAAMASKPHIAVEPRADGKWARQKNGTTRAASLHSTKSEAFTVATAQAKRERAELVVKGKDGTIQLRHSYGNDPRRSKG
jgi:hypothetical protein